MAYKVRQTGPEVQDVMDDVQNKIEVVTYEKNGYMSISDKKKLDELEDFDSLDNWDIDQIWQTS